MPLGNTFLPHESSKLMTQPEYRTKKGAIIEPIKSVDAFEMGSKAGQNKKVSNKKGEKITKKAPIERNADVIKF